MEKLRIDFINDQNVRIGDKYFPVKDGDILTIKSKEDKKEDGDNNSNNED